MNMMFCLSFSNAYSGEPDISKPPSFTGEPIAAGTVKPAIVERFAGEYKVIIRTGEVNIEGITHMFNEVMPKHC